MNISLAVQQQYCRYEFWTLLTREFPTDADREESTLECQREVGVVLSKTTVVIELPSNVQF